MRRLWFLLFISAAVGVRLWLIQAKELSFDEYFTVALGLGIGEIQRLFNLATAHPAQEWSTLYTHLVSSAHSDHWSVFLNDLNPPVYFLGMGPWMLLTSLSPLWLRLPGLFAGLAAVVFMHQLCLRFFNPGIGRILTLVMGFSSIYLFYSTLARPYVFLLMLALLATNLCLEKRWRWYAVTCLLGLFTHLFFGLILVTHGVYLWLTEAQRAQTIKPWLISLIVPLLAATIWSVSVLSLQLSHAAGNAIFTPIPFMKLLWHHSIISRWIFYCDKPLPRWPEYGLDIIASALIWLAFISEIIRATFKKTGAWFHSESRQALLLGICWFFLPLILLTGLDLIRHTRLSGTERYLFLLSPGLLLMLGAILCSYNTRLRTLSMSALMILIALNTGVFLQQRGLPTENFQGLAERIHPTLTPQDMVLVMTGYPSLPALASYLPPDTDMASVTDFTHDSEGSTTINPGRISMLVKGHPHVFLVATYSQLASLQPIQSVLTILSQQGYQVDRTIDLGNIRLGGYALSRRQ